MNFSSLSSWYIQSIVPSSEKNWKCDWLGCRLNTKLISGFRNILYWKKIFFHLLMILKCVDK